MEQLEARIALSLEPITLADSSLFGLSADGRSQKPSISADGQLVVFESRADDLVPNDTNESQSDIFLFNRSSGQVSLVSTSFDGTSSGAFFSTNPQISADGRFVLFESDANNLLPGISGHQLYVRDLQLGTTVLVTRNVAGTGAGNNQSRGASISADGRYVVFESFASNLVADDANGRADVFVRDLQLGTTTMVSRNLAGDNGGDNDSYAGQMSGNGRFVLFMSFASNLVPNDASNLEDIYVRDLANGTTDLIDIDSNEVNQANAHSAFSSRAISADGRYVVFQSEASNLVPQNSNFQRNVFVRDRQLGTTELVSINTAGTVGSGGIAGVITPDGRHVGFVSLAADLVPGLNDTNGANDVFIRDLQTRTTHLVSANAAGTGTANGYSGTSQYPFDFSPGEVLISDDARYVAFVSQASDLVTDDMNGKRDVFIRDLQTNSTTLISRNRAESGSGDNGSYTPAVSSDFRTVAFESDAGNLVAGDNNAIYQDIFVRDLTAGTTRLASLRTPFFPEERLATAGGQLQSITPDGRYVAFISSAWSTHNFSDLTPDVFTLFGHQNAYVRDRLTGQVTVENVTPDGAAANGDIQNLRLSADGRYIAFATPQSLDAQRPSNGHQVYLRDRQAGVTQMVTVTPSGTASAGSEWWSDIAFSPDARYIAFTSSAQDLVTGFVDGNGNGFNFGNHDLFMRDRQTGVTRLVSHIASSTTTSGNAFSFHPVFSAEGSKLIFVSSASNLVDGVTDGNNQADVFAYDVAAGTVELVSITASGTAAGNQFSGPSQLYFPVVSDDGRYVVFGSAASDLVANDTNGATSDIFRRDLATHTTQLVSLNSAATGSAGNQSFSPSISADGRYIAFASDANNLVAGDTNNQRDVFVRDMSGGQTRLVSLDLGRGPADNVSDSPIISPNGRFVSFASNATDLVANFVDGNGAGQDLYVRDLERNVTDLVSVNHFGTASGNQNFINRPDVRLFNSDGSTLFFDAAPTDLIHGDRNHNADVLAYSFAGAGQIRGRLFDDRNGNGVPEAGEEPVSFWTVYFDANNNGSFDSGEANVQTDLAGNYAFTGLAAGQYTVSLVVQPGLVQTLPTSPSYTVSLPTADSVVTGQDFGVARAEADLAARDVKGPATAEVGREFAVRWTVENLATTRIPGDWQDAVYISSNQVLDAGALLLGVVPHAGGLDGNASYEANLVSDLPPLPEGNYYLHVRTDRRHQVDSDLQLANNVATSATTVAVGIRELTLDVAAGGTFSGVNQNRYFKLTPPVGRTLSISLDSATASGGLELYVRRAALPTPSDYDTAADQSDKPDQTVVVPFTEQGTYFVLVRSRFGDAAASAFTLTARAPTGLELHDVAPAEGGNSGQVTVAVHGANFTPNTKISLVLGPTAIVAVQQQFENPSLIFATFELTGRGLGGYDLRAIDGADLATQTNAFRVVAAQPADLEVRLIVPQVVRFGTQWEIVAVYRNPGNIDVSAPLLSVSVDRGVLGFQGEIGFRGKTVEFLGISGNGPAGILRPGQSAQIRLTFGATQPGDQIAVNGKILADPALSIDWIARKDSLRPINVPPEAWDVVFANFIAAAGTTTGDYAAYLARLATHLSSLGVYTSDVGRLTRFALQQADAQLPTRTLGTNVDIETPTPLLRLALARSFQQSISGRYQSGPFGRGWTNNWDIELSPSPTVPGGIEVHQNGEVRLFVPGGSPRGLFAEVNGSAVIDQVDEDELVLKEADGIRWVFSVPRSQRPQSSRPDLSPTQGVIQAFVLQGRGMLEYVEETHGDRITARRGASGRLIGLTHSNGSSLHFFYNDQERIERVEDHTGRTVLFTYDASGEHLLTASSSEGTLEYGYVSTEGAAKEHALRAITNLDGTEFVFEYDGRGRMVRTARSGNVDQLRIAYDDLGGITLRDQANGSTTLRFDDSLQLEALFDESGGEARFNYDGRGNLVRIIDPVGQSQEFQYDGRDNLTRWTDALGETTEFAYALRFDQLTELRDSLGRTTRFSIDPRGDLSAVTYADHSSSEITSDGLGRLDTATNRRGLINDYTVDSRGLITRIDRPRGKFLAYTYDDSGRLLTAADNAGTTLFEYNDPQQPDQITRIVYPNGRFLRFSYDRGRRSQMVDSSGQTINYHYDDAGRLDRLSDADNRLIVQYAFDDAGRMKRKDYGNLTYTTYQYDSAGQLEHLINFAPNGEINSRFDYTYDVRGLQRTATTSEGTTNYDYDANGQLISVALPGGRMIQYQYDSAGNRTHVVDDGQTMDYMVNELNQYTAVGTATYTYDSDGNLKTRTDAAGTTTYAFDDLNQLISVDGPAGPYEFEYDALGNRVAVTHDGQRTEYLVDPIALGDIVGEFDATGNNLAHYAHGIGLAARLEPTGATAFYDFDAIGSTIGVTDASGVYVNRYNYLPFGETNTLASGISNPFTYVGELGVMDDGAPLLYMRNRYYDPATAQFASEDPLGLRGGDVNLRTYAENNPISLVDPSGNADVVRRTAEGMYEYVSTDESGKAISTIVDRNAERPQDRIKQKLDVPERGYERYKEVKRIEGRQSSKLTGQVLQRTGLKAAFNRGQSAILNRAIRQGALRFAGGVSAISNLLGTWEIAKTIPEAARLSNELGRSFGNWLVGLTGAFDPNQITGPAGFGDQHFTQPPETYGYQIDFENEPQTATAPGQEVFVTHTLDADLNLATFALGDIGFGSIVISVPSGLQSYQTSVEYVNQDGSPLRVDVSAELNLATRVVTWTFRSVDPETGLLPDGVFDGFLPVNDDTGRGQGFVGYVVRPKTDLATGTTIDATASIVFDINDPVVTDTFTNTIDAGPPTSFVNPLPGHMTSTSFTVSWTGNDDTRGSGIASFDVFVSDNGGPYVLFRDDTTATSATFTGQLGHTYRFYTVASDNVGHLEGAPQSADATTIIDVPIQPLFALSAISGPPVAVPGQLRSYSATFADGGTGGSYTATIDWGDGTTSPGYVATASSGGATNGRLSFWHTYTTYGDHVVRLSLRDGSGNIRAAEMPVTVQLVTFQTDPLDLARRSLVVGGFDRANDEIVFEPAASGVQGGVQLSYNGYRVGPFAFDGSIVAFGQGGDDVIRVDQRLSRSAMLFGQEGNDILVGGAGTSVLVGGAGNDQLFGLAARDLLFGGLGADTLYGNRSGQLLDGDDGDLVCSEFTTWEYDPALLASIFSRWQSPSSYPDRLHNLRYELSPALNNTTVFDDFSIDRLIGGTGRDWFLFYGVDDVLDAELGEEGLGFQLTARRL